MDNSPKYRDADFNQLQPENYVVSLDGRESHPSLQNGVVWKVQSASPNTTALELAALNHPEHTVPLTHEAADTIRLVRLSPYFVFEAYQAHYLRFEESGWYLWVEDVEFPKSVDLRAYNRKRAIQAKMRVVINDLRMNNEEEAFERFFEYVTRERPDGVQIEGFSVDESRLTD